MGEEDYGNLSRPRRRWRVWIALLVVLVLLVAFHRPLLLGIGYRVALHYAAKEHLKLAFQVEGSVFTNLTIRNLHATPTGPTDIESIDADFVHVDYGLLTLIRHGLSEAVSNAEVRSARVVVNPANTPRKPKPPNKKDTLYDFFPERVRVTDATVVVRDHPQDLVMEHVDLVLDPRKPGELRMGKLQLFGGQTWKKISAGTSYTNRDLVLRDLVLAENERIRSLSLDASKIAAGKLEINLDYPIGEGHISAAIGLAEAQRSINTDWHIKAENIPAGVLNKYLALPEDRVRGQIDKLNVDLKGLVNSPRTWNGRIMWDVRDLHAHPVAFDHGVFQIVAGNGTANIESADITQGQNQFHLRGSANLPAKIEELGRAPAKMEMTARIPDLKQATAEMNQKISGSAEGTGKIEISGGKIEADLAVTGTLIGFEKGAAEKVTANIKATKIVQKSVTGPRSTSPRPGASTKGKDDEPPWFAGLKSETTLTVSNLTYNEYAADSVEGVVRNAEDAVTFDHLIVRRKRNELTVHGEYKLAADLSKSDQQPGKIDISLNAPEVGDYWASETTDKFTGPLQLNGQLEFRNGAANGQFTIDGAGLKARELVFRELSSHIAVANNVIYLNDFRASLNEHDFAAANGTVELRAPFKYRGEVMVNIADLAVLEPLLRISGNQRQLGGSLVLNWEGTGEAKTFRNSGKLKLVLEKGRYGEVQGLQANVESSYTPEGLEIPIIFFANDRMNFEAIAQAKGETLEITKIELDQEKAKYASGYVSIPFVWKNIGTDRPLSPPNGNVRITFQSENLDLKKLFEDIGMKPAASGSMNVKLDARGTLGKLDARLDVQMRDLRQPEMPNFEPASVDLSMVAHDNELNIAGRLQQAKIQPLVLTAKMPFDAAKIAETGHIPDETPVTGRVQLPRSSVNFIRQFAPALQQIDGDMALDVEVSGTIGKPVLTGSGDITINVARSTNTTIPALTNFKARLEFRDDTLTLQQFGGELSGGKFTMTGGAKFPKIMQPELDLTFKAESALIARSDSLTARADADIRIVGPLNSATVTGTIATTDSKFLKNIDLLPIGLPGRPPPQPPESRPEFSFPGPLLRDWKFDVVLKTKDPFKIRGNLAYGGAVADMHLIGTGLHPGLQGQVRLENVEATLPFSRLEIAYGFLYFDPSDSLNPKMDLHGRSVIRDYTIHVYIYGTTLAPEAVFSSEPPLPQEEIISLLATGTTREELTGNNNVLAGRAATLLVQQLYRKIFKKGGGTENTSVFDRLDLEVGQTDPRTGQQQATARFKLNDQFVLLGDLDVGGGFKGMVKYLIRFH